MNFKKFVIGFITVFAITFLVSIGVHFLWRLVFHKAAIINLEEHFRIAIIFGIIIPVIDSRKRMKSKNQAFRWK